MSNEINQSQPILLESEIHNGRERLSSDRMDVSFGELINMYKSHELIIKPDYQRLYRWTSQQKTDLIESLLIGIPVPPIFVAEDKEGIWELIDGLQRLSTIISFFGELEIKEDLSYTDGTPQQEKEGSVTNDLFDSENEEDKVSLYNKWKLEEGALIKSLKDLNVDTLPSKYKINLKRAVCRVEILRGESNTSMKYELFKRLNSSGSKLTPQEMRNAIFRSVNPALINLIIQLSTNDIFKKLTNLTPQKLKELYHHELVLKFIALVDNASNVNQNTENFLNSFMEEYANMKTFNQVLFEDKKNKFERTLELLDSLNDTSIFRNSNNFFVPSQYEGIMIGLAQNIEKYQNNKDILRHKIHQLKTDAEFKKFSGVASNSKNRIKNRLLAANRVFSEI